MDSYCWTHFLFVPMLLPCASALFDKVKLKRKHGNKRWSLLDGWHGDTDIKDQQNQLNVMDC